jgi:hypothetical protein
VKVNFLRILRAQFPAIFSVPGADVLPAKRDPVGLQVRAQLRVLRQGQRQVRRLAHRAQQVPGRQDATVSQRNHEKSRDTTIASS